MKASKPRIQFFLSQEEQEAQRLKELSRRSLDERFDMLIDLIYLQAMIKGKKDLSDPKRFAINSEMFATRSAFSK